MMAHQKISNSHDSASRFQADITRFQTVLYQTEIASYAVPLPDGPARPPRYTQDSELSAAGDVFYDDNQRLICLKRLFAWATDGSRIASQAYYSVQVWQPT